jgi:hypothetical protein
MELPSSVHRFTRPLRGQLQRFVTWLFDPNEQSFSNQREPKTAQAKFRLTHFHFWDGGQRTTAAVLSLLGFLCAVPLSLLGGGQRKEVARTRLTSGSSPAHPDHHFNILPIARRQYESHVT